MEILKVVLQRHLTTFSLVLLLVRFYFVKDWFNMSVSCAVGACQVYHVTEMTAASWRLFARLCCDGHCLVGEGRRTGGGHALKLILLRVFYLTDHFPFLCSWSHGNFNSYLLSTSPKLFNISQMHDLMSFSNEIETLIISSRFCRFFSTNDGSIGAARNVVNRSPPLSLSVKVRQNDALG